MKKLYTIILFAIVCINVLMDSFGANAQGAWNQKASLAGTARNSAIGFSIGTKGYIGIGWDGNNNMQDFWEWDQVNDVWTQKANFGGTARSGAVGFSINTKGYIGTGWSGSLPYEQDFWEWDQATNTWAQKANFAGGVRANAIGFSIGSKGYIGTGFDGSAYKQDFWEWDQATDTWSQKANFAGGARYKAVGFSIGTKGYIGTGTAGSSNEKDFWEWDPSSNMWTQKANLAAVRTSAVGFSIAAKGYIGTGSMAGGPSQEIWEWDQANNAWMQKASLSGTARSGSIGFSIGTKGYIGTGFDLNNSYKNDFYEWDASSTSCVWKMKALFGGTSRSAAAGFSIGTKGYIGTGFDGTNNKQDFWEWDVSTNVWTQKADYGGGAVSSAVGFSIGTKGYISTGDASTNYSSLKTDLWEWDPTSNTWTQKASLSGNARADAIAFSIGTKGYVATGFDGSAKLQDLWEYDQINDTWTQKANFAGTARRGAAGFSIGTKGYIGTGQDGSGYTKDFWEWDQLADSWTQKANFAGTARWTAVGFSISTKGYIGTGQDGTRKKDFWEWDQATNAWTPKTDFGGVPRQAATGFSIGNNAYIATGYFGSGFFLNDLWEYNRGADVLPSICLITVDSLSLYNVIVWDKSYFTNTSVDSFIIYRDTANNNFAPIGEVSYDSLSQFIDTVRTLYAANGNPLASSWRYKLQVKDVCGNYTPMSPYHQTIFIQNVAGNFFWNHYQIEGQPIPVPALTNYLFQRDNFSTGNFVTAQTLSASSTAYTDGAYTAYQNTGTWRVRTVWSISCTPTVINPKDPLINSINLNSSRSNIYRANGAGVNEITNAIKVSVLPNPSNGSFTIQANSQQLLANSQIEIYNVMGEKIYEQLKMNNAQSSIDLSSQPNGIYFLHIKTEQGTAVKKIVVNK